MLPASHLSMLGLFAERPPGIRFVNGKWISLVDESAADIKGTAR